MRVQLTCCAAIALYLCALPLAAQEDGSTDSVDLQEQAALDPHALAVLPIEILTNDPRGPSLAADVYDKILNQLASINGLYVIQRESVLPYADSSLSAKEIARQLGVGSILEISIRVDYSAGYILHLQHISALAAGSGFGGGFYYFDPDTLLGVPGLAESVENWLFPKLPPDPQQVIAEAQAKVLNTGLSDSERLDALKGLRYRGVEARSGAVAVAAAQLALNSEDPYVRAGIWSELAGVDDPYLIQPLLHSLANDGEQFVRRQAAETLRDFLDEPSVRDALEYAGENDASEEVRKETHFSMLSDAEQHDQLRATAMDTTLTQRERSQALSKLRWGFEDYNPEVFSGELAIAIVELAKNADDPELRTSVLFYLTEGGDPYVVQPLLEVLANDPDENVRHVVAEGLAGFLDHPGVREGLEEALVSDTSPLVRKAAEESIKSVNLNR